MKKTTSTSDAVREGSTLFEFGDNMKSEKSLEEQMNEIFNCIDKLLEDMSLWEGKRLLGALFWRYSRMFNYIKKQALRYDSNDSVVKEQFIKVKQK